MVCIFLDLLDRGNLEIGIHIRCNAPPPQNHTHTQILCRKELLMLTCGKLVWINQYITLFNFYIAIHLIQGTLRYTHILSIVCFLFICTFLAALVTRRYLLFDELSIAIFLIYLCICCCLGCEKICGLLMN